MLKMTLLFSIVLFAFTTSSAEPLDEFIQNAMKEYRVPGASIAIVRDGKVTELKGYGVRTAGRPEKVDPDTIFSLASLTKPFTAVLVAGLVEDGKLGWTRRLSQDFPQIRLAEAYPTAEVTVRDLLVHRSGLPAFQGDFFDVLGYERDEVIERIGHMPLSLGFRKEPGYSNVGFFLAGEAASHSMGTTYEKALDSRVLQPLGLTRTGFWHGTIQPEDNVASPHVLESGVPRNFPTYDEQKVLAPAGLLTSTARDLSRFMLLHLDEGRLDGKQFLNPDSIATLFEPVVAEEPGFSEMPPISPSSGYDYSPGWGVYHVQNQKVVEKGGARTGVRTLIVMVPEKNLGIAVLCNLNGTAFPEAVRARILAEELGFDDQAMQTEILSRQKSLDKMFGSLSTRPQPVPKAVAPMTVEPQNLIGVYHSPLYGELVVERSGPDLRWKAGDAGYGGRLYPLGNSTYVMDVPPGALPGEATFVVDENGRAVELQTEDYGRYTKKD